VAGFLDEAGVTAPHVVGNSLGGWVALELATICPVTTLTLLSPAGLWRSRTPRYAPAPPRAPCSPPRGSGGRGPPGPPSPASTRHGGWPDRPLRCCRASWARAPDA